MDLNLKQIISINKQNNLTIEVFNRNRLFIIIEVKFLIVAAR